MVARMLNKETGEETVLIDKKELDFLNEQIKDLEERMERRRQFYVLADYELNLYRSSWLCRAALSITLFFKKLFGGEV